MATQIPPVITPVPTPAIQRNDRTTFSNRVDAFVTWLITGVAQFGAVATNVYNNAVDAAASASSAFSNKGLSQAAADAAESYRTQAKNSADAAAASALTIGTTAAFSDANPMVKNATVNTKQGRFKATAISAGAIRDYILPDKDGTMALTSDTGMALLATISATAAANIDFLNVFSATYDGYFIRIDGVAPATGTAESLAFRFANAGVVDASAIYAYENSINTNTGGGAQAYGAITQGDISSSADKAFATLEIFGANSTTAKVVFSRAYGIFATRQRLQTLKYSGASPVSGIRFMWASGVNFSAAGVIRIYGFKNQ